MTHARGIRLPDIDPHASPASLPPELRAVAAWRPAADPEADAWWCCEPEAGPDGWQHERSCPARRRTA